MSGKLCELMIHRTFYARTTSCQRTSFQCSRLSPASCAACWPNCPSTVFPFVAGRRWRRRKMRAAIHQERAEVAQMTAMMCWMRWILGRRRRCWCLRCWGHPYAMAREEAQPRLARVIVISLARTPCRLPCLHENAENKATPGKRSLAHPLDFRLPSLHKHACAHLQILRHVIFWFHHSFSVLHRLPHLLL